MIQRNVLNQCADFGVSPLVITMAAFLLWKESTLVIRQLFAQVLGNPLYTSGMLLWHFPGLESPGKTLLVLESAGNLFNS